MPSASLLYQSLMHVACSLRISCRQRSLECKGLSGVWTCEWFAVRDVPCSCRPGVPPLCPPVLHPSACALSSPESWVCRVAPRSGRGNAALPPPLCPGVFPTAEGTESDPETGGRTESPTQHLASLKMPGPPKCSCPDSSPNNLLHLFQGKYEERFLKDETISQQINSVESLPELHLSPEDEKPKQLLQRKLHMRSRPPSKPTIVRGVTYYKAQSTESENDIEEQRELGLQPCPAGWLAASLSKASACPRVLPCPPGTCGQSLWGHRGEEGLEAGGGGTIGTELLEAARQHPAFEPCAGEQGGDVIPWKNPW